LSRLSDADGVLLGPSAGPLAPSRRIDGIDVLRGLALFGVLISNLVFAFRVSVFAQFLPPAETEYGIERSIIEEMLAIT